MAKSLRQSAPPGSTPVFSIIVPTLNEVDNIDPLFERVLACLQDAPPFELIVVDDQSTDATPQRAAAWADRLPIRVVCRSGPADLSAAIVDGAKAARARYLVVLDADGSHPPERIAELLAPLIDGSADLTIGSRHAPGGSTRGWPWYRQLGSRLATAMAWPFTEVKDPMAGFFATTRQRILNLPRHTSGYKILLELLVQGGDEMRAREIPIAFDDRTRGRSKLGLGQQWIYLKRLCYLAGGRISAGSAGRFILVGLSGMLVDLLIFQWLVGLSTRLGSAHVLSFVIATITNFTLNFRWTFRGPEQARLGLANRYLRFLIVAVLALMIRGGVLVTLVEVGGLSPMAAIIPAIILTAAVNYFGSAFYVFASTASGIVPRVRWHLAALGLFCYVLVLRLAYLGQLELIPDEMYYWVYSQQPALSYLDHPPLIAWLIGLGTAIAGDTIFGVRLLLIPMSLGGAVFFYLYGSTMCGKSAGLMCILAVTVAPFFAASGVLMTPDAPMLVAWVAALYFFKRALVDQRGSAFVGLGLAMGLGLLAKYTIALLAPAALVYMLSDRRCWHWFGRPEPYLSVLLSVLIISPVLVWNANNQWASLLFQSTRRLFENPDLSSHLVVVYAVLLLSPVIALAGFQVLGRARLELSPDQRKRRFMLIMSLVPLGFFLVYGLFTVIKFHWTLPAWIALLPMIMNYLAGQHWSANPPLTRYHKALARAFIPSVVALVICYGLVLHYFTLGLPGIKTRDFGTAYLGWNETARTVQELQSKIEEQTGQRPIVASTSKWSGAAALAWHLRPESMGRITGQNLIGMSGSMWEYWFDPNTGPRQPVLLVNRSPKLIGEAWLERAVVGLGPIQEIRIRREGALIAPLYYRIAEGFRPEQVRYPDRIPE